MIQPAHYPADNPPPPDTTPSCCSADHPACACPAARGPWLWLLSAALVLLLVVSLARRTHNSSLPAQTIAWTDDYDDALALAKQQNKPLLLAFSAPWCPYCRQMQKTAYVDPHVVEISRRFIPVRIDTDNHPALVEKYAVGPIPAYFILAPDGARLAQSVGATPPADFAAWLNQTLAPARPAPPAAP